MKKLFLMGRSEAGKTSLTQAMNGEDLHYHKTQYTNTGAYIIDSPGEYAETKHCGLGLACFSFEADCQCYTNRPLIGIITRIHSPYANIPMVRNWMQISGCERIFEVDSATKEGIDELKAYLNDDPVKRTWQEARALQDRGLNEWDDPEKYGITL